MGLPKRRHFVSRRAAPLVVFSFSEDVFSGLAPEGIIAEVGSQKDAQFIGHFEAQMRRPGPVPGTQLARG